MKEKEFLLSVIVPVYNGAKYIHDLMDSILAHNDPEEIGMEIIFVDDGSKDDSRSVCQKICEKHDYARYAYKPNGDIASARNHGLELARGTYVTFADQDDRIFGGGGTSRFCSSVLMRIWTFCTRLRIILREMMSSPVSAFLMID